MRTNRLRRLFTPGRRAVGALGIGILLAATVFCCLAVLVLAAPPARTGAPMSGPEIVLFGFVWVVLPGLVLFVVLAALLEKRNPPRALLWLGATLLLALAGLLTTLMMLVDIEGGHLTQGTVMLTVVVAPVVLLFSLPTVYFGARSIAEVRAALLDDLSRQACELVQARGEMTFAQLAQELDIPVGEVDDLLDELLRAHELNGVMYATWQRVYTATALAEKQRSLLELLRAQGRVYLPAIPAMLKVPRELVHDWLYQLVQRGQFEGCINWKQGWLYSVTVRQLGADSQCPQCGGTLSAGPALTVRCLHCGSEMLFRNRN